MSLQVSGGKDSVSTDTETPFIFADVTDYLLDVGGVREVHIAMEPPVQTSSTHHASELAVVTDHVSQLTNN